MKKYTVVVMLLINSLLYSDPQSQGEMFYSAVGAFNNINVKATAEIEVWDENWNITNLYDEIEDEIPLNGILKWDIVYHQGDGTSTFGFTKYKIDIMGFTFYIDYTDCRLRYYDVSGIDVWFKYDFNDQKVYFRRNVTGVYTQIQPDTTLEMWVIFEQENPPSRTCFQPATPINFSGDFSGLNPFLTWNQVTDPPNVNIEYEIQRNINNNGWIQIGTNITGTQYTDTSIESDEECSLKYRV